MTSKVLDLTTVAHALTEISTSFLGDCEWSGINEEQREFLTWYAEHRDEISKLDSLDALASTNYAELNNFLTTRGFGAMFQPFNGIGVAAILDMLVEWLLEGEPTHISRYERSGGVGYLGLESSVDYPAFMIEAKGVDIYGVEGYKDPLLRLHTKTGHSLWLMKAAEPASGLELNRQARYLLTAEHRPQVSWTAGVIIPMLEMDCDGDVGWMMGAKADSPTRGEFEVAKVAQKFKLRANAKGARIKVATVMVLRAACAMTPPPPPYELNDPFIGFFTQPGNDTLPLAAFWADTDVWQNSGGTLEEL